MQTTTPAPTSTTTTYERDGDTITRTEWDAINGYTLIMTDYGQWKTWNVRSAHGLPEVVDQASYEPGVPPTFGVNWSAMGTVDAQDARAYAAQIAAAADVADQLTAIAAAAN